MEIYTVAVIDSDYSAVLLPWLFALRACVFNTSCVVPLLFKTFNTVL